MKKRKRSDKPTNFVVDNAAEAFTKMEDAARRLFASPSKGVDRGIARPKPTKRK